MGCEPSDDDDHDGPSIDGLVPRGADGEAVLRGFEFLLAEDETVFERCEVGLDGFNPRDEECEHENASDDETEEDGAK